MEYSSLQAASRALRLSMSRFLISRLLLLLLVGCHLPSAFAQDFESPIGPKWWPSEWGPEDQRGAANRITPEKVLQATKLIRTGKLYQLGRVYEKEMPLPEGRSLSLRIPATAGGPYGENQTVEIVDSVQGELGHVGTQLDGLGHVGVRLADDDYFYNGFKHSQFSTTEGLNKLGVENIGAIFTRGVLVDVAKYKHVDRLEPGYVVTARDIQETLKMEGIEITPGDVVVFRTGHGKLWMKNNDLYNSGEPGIDVEAARWLIEKKIVMLGSDTWANEAFPSPDKKTVVPAHQLLIIKNGIYSLENLDLEQLGTDQVYEFAFVFTPLKLKGAAGAPGNPIAVR
jgi:kynurenine formamidase